MGKENRAVRHARLASVRRRDVIILAGLALGGTALYFAWDRQHFAGSAFMAALTSSMTMPSSSAVDSTLVEFLAESAITPQGHSRQVRVGVFRADDGGTATIGNLAHILETESTWTWERVAAADIRAGLLSRFDVLVFPGGSGSKQAAALGEEGKQAVRRFVRSGGGCIGICGGAFLTTAEYEWSLALVNAKILRGKKRIAGVGLISMAARGSGMVKMELTEAGRRILGDIPDWVEVSYSGGPILAPAGRADLPEYVCLAWYRSEIWEYEPQRGTMIDTPAIVAARFGKGAVIAFSPHPEATKELEPLVKRAILATARRRVVTDHKANVQPRRCVCNVDVAKHLCDDLSHELAPCSWEASDGSKGCRGLPRVPQQGPKRIDRVTPQI